MIRTILSSLFLGSVLTSLAQPTLNVSSAAEIGQSFTYRGGTYQEFPDAGENVTWDAHAVGASGTVVLDVVDPSDSPFADEFGNCNRLLITPGNSQFCRADATGFYITGLDASSQGLKVHYSDEQLLMPYPCTFGTEFSDEFAYTYDIDGTTVFGTGASEYTVDGYGSLVLPWGTVQNVIKLTGMDSTMEDYDGTLVDVVSENAYFFRPGPGFHVLRAFSFSVSVDGDLVQSDGFLSYQTENSMGMEDLLNNDIGVDVYPVPAHDQLNVVYAMAGGRRARLDLVDGLGRIVRTMDEGTVSAGVQRSLLSVEDLPGGIYVLRISDDRGQRGTRQVVIE